MPFPSACPLTPYLHLLASRLRPILLLLLASCCAPAPQAQAQAQAASGASHSLHTPEPIHLPYRKHRNRGFYRKEVKTRAVRQPDGQLAPATEYATVLDLLRSLPPDSVMHARYADMRKTRGLWGWFSRQNREIKRKLAVRFPEEARNVSVTGFLYAIKQMNDRDYHLVMLSAPDTIQVFRAMNVEISGLDKKNPDHQLLVQARHQALHALGKDAGLRDWTIYYPSMPRIRITGALFFDGKKERTHMKPGYLRPVTAWEVHPIYSIELLSRLPSHIIQW
ncbi:MAG TPA: hypothetical protein PK971_13880 [Saprospiraceae bacterium]|nr:hypothetical protein [Saprospiraceae bacterium]